MPSRHTVAALALGGFFTATGLGHFLAAPYFRSLVPAWIPAPGAVVAASGIAEIAVAGSLFVPQTRVAGGWAAVVLIGGFLVVWLDALRRVSSGAERFADRPLGMAAVLAANAGYLLWAGYIAVG
ncbi:hypothetical protein IU433_07155 [Nocardia puris]|nr:hypothetical protein [Nocardia puris]MBF6458819.1 hypothetical protein [Nocardia puris]